MRILFVVFMLFCTAPLMGQDTAVCYFTSSGIETTSADSAAYYRAGKKNGQGQWVGTVKEFSKNNVLLSKGAYTNSLRNGEFIFYHPNGAVASQGMYANNAKVKEWEYFSAEGVKTEEGSYFKDAKHGLWKTYYANGWLREEAEYSFDKQGEPKQQFSWYDSTGRQLVAAGNGFCSRYDAETGVQQSGAYVNGQKNGTWTGKYRATGYTFTETYIDGKLTGGELTAKNNRYTYTAVATPPQMKESIAEYYAYIQQNLRYPAYAREAQITGRVFVACTVDEKGKITAATIKRSVNPALDREALRIIYTLPLFIPATMRGMAVSGTYALPVDFKLN